MAGRTAGAVMSKVVRGMGEATIYSGRAGKHVMLLECGHYLIGHRANLERVGKLAQCEPCTKERDRKLGLSTKRDEVTIQEEPMTSADALQRVATMQAETLQLVARLNRSVDALEKRTAAVEGLVTAPKQMVLPLEVKS